MRLFTDLLFLHGHITNVELARALAGTDGSPSAPAPGSRREGKATEQAQRHAPVPSARTETTAKPTACLNP